jgi:hypothetical protein
MKRFLGPIMAAAVLLATIVQAQAQTTTFTSFVNAAPTLTAPCVAGDYLAVTQSSVTKKMACGPGVFAAITFGAVCDNSTVTTTAIQATINAAQSAGGGTVLLPPGKCITGALTVTASGVHIKGAGPTATTLKPVAGSYNVISFTGSSSVQDGGVEDLSFDNASLTSGDDIHISNYQRITINAISSFSTKTFLYNASSNSMQASNLNIFNVSGAYCVKLTAPGSTRSDAMNFTNVNCGGGTASTYVALVVDGYVNTVRVHAFAASAPTGGGILWENAVGADNAPQFLFAHDFEVEQSSGKGYDFEAGNTIYCANCYSNFHTDSGVYIAATVSNVNFTNPSVTLNGKYGFEDYGYGGGTGTTGLTITGGNVSANSDGSHGTYQNILIGSTARNVTVTGVNMGGSTVNYAAKIVSGANLVTFAGNNYTGATTGSIQDLSGAASILSGTDYAGVAYGPTIQDGGHSGTLDLTMLNAGVTSSTVSQYLASTGTANAYVSIGNKDGSTPTGLITAGSGDTGGIEITPSAGHVAFNGSAGGVTVGSPTGGDKGAGTVNATGLYVNGTAVGGGAGTVTSITAGTGLTGGTITSTGTIALDLTHANDWTGAQGAHLNNSQALYAGQNGATNPAFNVDTTTASSVTGLNIASEAAGAGTQVTTLSTGTNEGLSISAKGSGILTLNGAGTGAVNDAHELDVGTALANYVAITGNTTTNPVAVSASGSDTNINLNLNPKGSGSVVANGPMTITGTLTGAAANWGGTVDVTGSNVLRVGGTGGSGQIAIQKAATPTFSILKTGILEVVTTIDSSNYYTVTGNSKGTRMDMGGGNFFAPFVDADMNLGDPSFRWKNGYFSGNVGIGMTPVNVLDITQTQNGDSTIALLNATNGTGAAARFDLRSPDSSHALTIQRTPSSHTGTIFGFSLSDVSVIFDNSTTSNGLLIGTTTSSPVIFGVGNAEAARFAAAGNLILTGVGTQQLTVGRQGATNPAFNVDASIASQATGINVVGSAAGGGAHISAVSSATDESITIDGKNAGTVSLNSGGTGSITVNIATDAAQTDRTVCQNTSNNELRFGTGTLGICLGTSSRRFKTGIEDLQPGLAAIMGLRPRSFYLDAAHGDPAKLNYGFIAEEADLVLPALIGRDAQGVITTFDYLGVVPVLVKAVQQQQAQIDAAGSQFGALVARQVETDHKIDTLETRVSLIETRMSVGALAANDNATLKTGTSP